MDIDYTLPLEDTRATLALVGGKGSSLARLARAGLPVPDGFHVVTTAYRQFVAAHELQPAIDDVLKQVDVERPATLEKASLAIRELFVAAEMPPAMAGAIVEAYNNLPGQDPAVAVRSSATAEDLPEASFAGQQETYLNVSGAEELLRAVRACWASLWTARAIGYRARRDIPPQQVALAVVVQRLVPAEAAGILFTANPLTGARQQAMISAAWGLGEAVVGGTVTPDTIVVDKANGRVLQRETADKQVMTVRVDGGTREQPVPEDLRQAPVLSDEAAAELARLAATIEQLYQMPMDVEWARADGAFAIVQARPITALPEADAASGRQLTLPDEWRLPEDAYMAMRNNIVELMTEPLTPLFGTLGLRAVNASMGRLLTTFFGKPGIMPQELIITVNEYAYYNGSLSAGQMAQIFLRSVGIARRMFTGAVERWLDEGRPHYMATVERWQAEPWRQWSAEEILRASRALSEAAIGAYGVLVSGVIPAAWISEAIFTLAYRLVRRRGDPPAPTYLMGFDSRPIQAEKALYDLAQWARADEALAAYLKETPATELAIHGQGPAAPQQLREDIWREWQQRFQTHLDRYGHMIYNLDFANPVPADHPAPLLETLKLFLRGQGVNPHRRQRETAERRQQATQAMMSRLHGLRLRIFRATVEPAQRYAPLREDGLSDIGLAYPLLREVLLELGRRLVDGGVLDAPDDIFWLKEGEVVSALQRQERGEEVGTQAGTVMERKAQWQAAKRLTPPRALMRILGRNIARMTPGRSGTGDGARLKGVGASPGRVTAPARVLHGPEEFDRMRPGDVLVASITTPAWTPLFAMAAAIVTDIGGPLSHGSIVAREYQIPAVLGTDAATSLIRNGQLITVDGDEGKVYLSGG